MSLLVTRLAQRIVTAGIFLCFISISIPNGFAQGRSNTLVIEGKVCDQSASPLSGAAIFLATDADASKPLSTTDTNGHFSFKITKGRIHVFRIMKEGFKPRIYEIPDTDAEKTSVDIVLEIALGKMVSDIEFSDTPNFTVAGVTDWSNVGLHGSDVKVKTSEALSKEAASLKSPATSSSPTNAEADAHRRLGDEKEKTGDPVAAEREYERAVKLDPSEANYFAWGAELLLHRAGIAAVEVLTKGVALYPASQRMIEALGAAFYANGQYPEAAEQMCRATDLDLATLEPYLLLGRIEQASTDIFPCSEEKMHRFMMKQRGNPQLLFYNGVVVFKRARQSQQAADFRRAQGLFLAALKIDPMYAEVHVQLGMLYNAWGKYEDALRSFNNAVSFGPGVAEAHYHLSLAYRRAGRSAKADEEMKKYEELHRAEEAALEKERKEMKQFVTILQQSSPKQ